MSEDLKLLFTRPMTFKNISSLKRFIRSCGWSSLAFEHTSHFGDTFWTAKIYNEYNRCIGSSEKYTAYPTEHRAIKAALLDAKSHVEREG